MISAKRHTLGGCIALLHGFYYRESNGCIMYVIWCHVLIVPWGENVVRR
jgi:hypothetical protein